MASEVRSVVKEVPHAKLYSDGTIFVGPLRLSYFHGFKPYQGEDGKGKYGVVGLMPKGPEYRAAKDLIVAEVKRIINETGKLKDIDAGSKFIRDGDLKARDEYSGMFTINASETKPPKMRDSRRDPKTNRPRVLEAGKDEDRIYSGCWGNLLIRPWWQNNKYGKKVNAGLVAVQFVKDDEPFGTGRVSEEDVDETFDEFTDEDSGFDDELGDDDEL